MVQVPESYICETNVIFAEWQELKLTTGTKGNMIVNTSTRTTYIKCTWAKNKLTLNVEEGHIYLAHSCQDLSVRIRQNCRSRKSPRFEAYDPAVQIILLGTETVEILDGNRMESCHALGRYTCYKALTS